MLEDCITQLQPLTQFQCLSDSEVLKLVEKSPTKSCKLDVIPTSLLKDLKQDMVPVLTKIVNQSLTSGIVPSALKNAIVTPVLKKSSADPELFRNYRPVSNLTFVSKLTERAVAKQYLEHCELNDLKNDFQSAYKANNSTETAITRVHNDILQALDKDGAAILVLLDLSAAFDTIDHTLLLQILEHDMKVSGHALCWFRSYLTNRTQTINICGSMSEKCDLSCGVPQGSVLGPILFTTYTRPLGKVISKGPLSYMLYADDTQLYMSFRPKDPTSASTAVAAVTSCVGEIKKWMSKFFLKLNEDKTEVLVLTTPSLVQTVNIPSIPLGDNNVEIVTSVRDLGVTLDSKLQFHQHVNEVVRSSYFQLHKIARVRKYLTHDATKSLVHGLVLSRLDYCNVVLYGLPDILVNKLQRVQNHAARLIAGVRKYDHVSPILQTLHWLPVDQRVIYKIVLLTFKALHGFGPVYIADLLTPYIPSRSLRSAGQGLLHAPTYRLKTYGARSFQCAAPRLWNQLPLDLRNQSNILTFKRHLKTYLFKQTYGL
jgi:hypothetical protein